MKKFIGFLLFTLLPVMVYAAPTTQALTLALNSYPNSLHAPIMIALQQDFFKEQGLNVKLMTPVNQQDAIAWLNTNKADIAILNQPQLMKQRDQGLPLVHIGTLIDKPLLSIVALKASEINTLADLKGKRIGSNNFELTTPILKNLLAKQGLTLKQVKLIPTKNLRQDLVAKKIDAAIGLSRNSEIPALEAEGQQLVVFFPEEHGLPNYSELVFVIHENHSEDPRLPRFLTAIKKSVAYLDEHPQESWQQFAKHYPKVNNQMNRQAWFATIPYFAEDPTYLNQTEWKNFAQFMYENELIKEIHPLSHDAMTFKNTIG